MLPCAVGDSLFFSKAVLYTDFLKHCLEQRPFVPLLVQYAEMPWTHGELASNTLPFPYKTGLIRLLLLIRSPLLGS